MAISPEVLNDALQELAPTYSNLFERFSPVLQKIVDKGNIERNRLRGPFKEFRVITQGPGDVTQIVDGGEVLASTRKDITAKGNTYGSRLIYSFLVPDKDMAEAVGPTDVEHIIKQYPEAALMDFHQRISQQLMNGNGSNVGGFLTFNGDTTYSPQGTGRTGVFDFSAEAGQSSTVFGLQKVSGGTAGWFNGYRDISSMASDGISKIRQAYFGASRRGKMSGPVDLLLADEVSYTNYIDLLDDRIIVEDSVKGEAGADDLKQGIKFLAATMYLEEFLDPTDTSVFTTAAPQGGVIYGLKTSTWHMYTLGSDAKMETAGDFAIRGPLRRPDMDAHQFEYVLYMGMFCDMLSANFAVTGGRVP